MPESKELTLKNITGKDIEIKKTTFPELHTLISQNPDMPIENIIELLSVRCKVIGVIMTNENVVTEDGEIINDEEGFIENPGEIGELIGIQEEDKFVFEDATRIIDIVFDEDKKGNKELIISKPGEMDVKKTRTNLTLHVKNIPEEVEKN